MSFATPPGEAALIVLVDPTVAQELRSPQPATGPGDRLREVVADAGLRMVPLHPDITTPTGPPDEDLMSYFVISVRSSTDVDQLVQNVQSLPVVRAAYLKPHDEAP